MLGRRKLHVDLGNKSWLDVYKNAISGGATRLENIWELCPKEYVKIKIMGKEVPLARYQRTFGSGGYAFSGQVTEAEPMPLEVGQIMDMVNEIVQPEHPFNMCLLNFYSDGSQYCGYHSDDTRQLHPGSPIACLSLGATRKFSLQPTKAYPSSAHSILLDDGDLVVMQGACQTTHKHSIPKMARAKGKRASLTFRCFK
eukprot:TRINITY_DN21321_c0_g1_i1.p1 TRINITY_DN21321_c0_g1~~TRINITY_DN21321_c0_g1_i1.p1  ORF type:complete len:198 (+),score=26.06 TRINITY_DN21321_c0_g1_i1:29-622(+)